MQEAVKDLEGPFRELIIFKSLLPIYETYSKTRNNTDSICVEGVSHFSESYQFANVWSQQRTKEAIGDD